MKLLLGKKDFEGYVRSAWPRSIYKERELKFIKKYYENFAKEDEFLIDNQSWDDLSMDDVYKLVDRTYSSAGESILYTMLRNPVKDKEKLVKRWNLTESIRIDEVNRVKIQGHLFDLSKDKRGQVIDFITNDIETNNLKRYLYVLLGRILPIIFLILSFYSLYFLGAFVANIMLNGFLAAWEKKNLLEKKPMEAIAYIGNMMRISKKILKLDCEILKDYKYDMESSIRILTKDKGSFRAVSRNNGVNALNLSALMKDAFKEAFGDVTLDVEIAYYKVAQQYKEYKEPIKKLYECIGEIDALIAVGAYLESIEMDVCNPEFSNEKGFKIEDGVHPLVENAVSNSINIDKKGIVITGTNMSGKSTFLRMLGINIIFAQSFNFVLAKSYKAPFLKLVSSISPKDDVKLGKSYYLAEAEAILRIIKSLDNETTVFCLIDEIFRGTNPVERIAASEEILKYIQQRNSISLVATHDRELTELLKESHDFYHFSEDISEKSGLSFDYKIKRGVLKAGNAIKLLKYIGYPAEIISKAEEKVRRYSHK